MVVDFAARFYWLIQRLVNEVEDQDIAEIYEYFEPRKLTLLSDYLNGAKSIGD
ncbi:MAG: hypothetical protein ACJ0UT_00885 [Candidatus Latescibacterota bacterium]